MCREMLVGSILLSVSLAMHKARNDPGPGVPIACWVTAPSGSLELSCSSDGVGLRINKGEPEAGYSMAEYGEVVLADGRTLPEVAALVSRRIDSVHGIYTAGNEDLLGIELVAGPEQVVVACWGDELSIGSALPEELRSRTSRL